MWAAAPAWSHDSTAVLRAVAKTSAATAGVATGQLRWER